MNPFFSLASLFKKASPPSETPEEFVLPLNLTSGTWNELKSLRSEPGFKTYMDALDEVVKFSAEALLAASTDENLHYHRGVIGGIRKAALLIDEIGRQEEAFLEDKKRRDRARREPSARPHALFGSPGWSNPRNS